MPKKEYESYDSWEKLLNKYEDVDFSDAKVRKNFRKDFEELASSCGNVGSKIVLAKN